MSKFPVYVTLRRVVWLPLSCMFLFGPSAFSAGVPAFQQLVVEADQRAGFVAVVAPSITHQCLQKVWGQGAPEAFEKWATVLMLDDLASRAKVLRGELTHKEALRRRRVSYDQLEGVAPQTLDEIATYVKMEKPGDFGPALLQVMECQMLNIGLALAEG